MLIYPHPLLVLFLILLLCFLFLVLSCSSIYLCVFSSSLPCSHPPRFSLCSFCIVFFCCLFLAGLHILSSHHIIISPCCCLVVQAGLLAHVCNHRSIICPPVCRANDSLCKPVCWLLSFDLIIFNEPICGRVIVLLSKPVHWLMFAIIASLSFRQLGVLMTRSPSRFTGCRLLVMSVTSTI